MRKTISADSQLLTHRTSIFVFALAVSSTVGAQDVKRLPQPQSPGAAIASATKAAAHDHQELGAVDILSNTEGVDFGPYLKEMLGSIRKQWYALIPENVQTKKGRLAIEFRIEPNGRVSEMKLVSTSGDVSLDHPAWDAIHTLSPFPELPKAFHGSYLGLRFRFYYNPDKAAFTNYVWPGVDEGVRHTRLTRRAKDSHPPEYPETALNANIEGIVRLEATVGKDGRVDSVRAIEGEETLSASAMQAIKNWRFTPAQKDGKKVADLVRINIEFRTEGHRVRSQIVWPDASSE